MNTQDIFYFLAWRIKGRNLKIYVIKNGNAMLEKNIWDYLILKFLILFFDAFFDF